MEVSGFILREEGDFYYLDLRPSEAEAEGELRSREESVSGSRRKLHRQSRIQQLSPVKEASTPVQAELTSQTSLDSTIDSTLGSEDSSLDMVDINIWDGEDVARVRQVYEELGVREAFTRYEEEFHSSIMARIEGVQGLPPALFTLFLDRVYKRTR